MERIIRHNIFLLLVLILIVFSCKSKKNPQIIYSYKILKIDSLNNYYIIHIENNNKKYQVVSKKTDNNCNTVKINYTYPAFMLEPLIKEDEYMSKDQPMNYLDFVPNKIKLDDSTIIKKDRDMDNIYQTSNLNGLCYISLTPMIKK